MVRSLLKVLKRILPAQIYETLYYDVVSLFTQQNHSSNNNTTKSYSPDQFEKFANFLVSLLCNKESVSQIDNLESNLLSKQKLKLAQTVT